MCTSRQENAFPTKLIEAAGAHAADRITIAGTRNLDLLLALYEHGFAHVACQAVTQGCPHDAQSAADILLIPHLAEESELDAVLRGLGPVLRAGGTLVLGCAGGQPAATRLRRKLAARGYVPESWMGGGEPDDLVLCARKGSATQHARAA